MSSGIAYPPPTYIPILSVFNPLFFPQSFGTTTSSGGGGGQTNIFPNGLTSGNVITLNGGTGGGGGTGVERTITGISYLDFVDSASTNPTAITGYITLNGNTLEIGSATASSGINVNLLGSVVSANGTPIGGGGDVFLAGNNTFTGTNTFTSTFSVDNTQTNIGQLPTGNNTAIGLASLGDLTSGNDNSAFGYTALQAITTGSNNTSLGYASLSSSLTDDNNTAVGYWSGFNLNGGGNNTYLGYESGYNQTTGSGNVAIGFQSGVDTTTPTLSNTIAIGNQVTSVATGDMILGFGGNYNSTGFPYYAKITPNTTDQGVQIQGSYNNSGNFTIDATGQSAIIKGTFINLNATGSGLAYGVNVLNGMNINGGTLNTSDKATQPPLEALYSSYYSYGGVPFYAFSDSGGITTHQELATTSSLSSYAPINSPTFTGTPLAPTATAGNNSTEIATTAFVATSFAPLASPTFTGIPLAPTATLGDNSTQLATTAFVQSAISGGSNTITLQWTAALVNGNTQWSGYIPYSVNATIVSFQFYSNTPPNNVNLAPGEQIVPSNTQVSGYGIGYKQPYFSTGTTAYGYVFSILSYNGLSIPSPNILLESVAIFPQDVYPCFGYLTGANDGGYIYTFTPNPNLTLIITQ